MPQTIQESQVAAALRAAEDPGASPEERAEMLMQIAMGLQSRPKSRQQVRDAVGLYERALQQGPSPLLAARIRARMGTALQGLPDEGADALERARNCYEDALSALRSGGRAEEVAEVQLNLGLTIQVLSGHGKARLQDALQCYHGALRVFVRETYPQEFAILHNNLAIAYLAIPATDERRRMREALAVQSFEEVLKVINIVEHPSEYAMVQNNLGNALQYASSGHALENNMQALAAYEEALKVRNPSTTPVEYANTIANMANVLRSVGGAAMAHGQEAPRARALGFYEEARELYVANGLAERAEMMAAAIAETLAEVQAAGNGRAPWTSSNQIITTKLE